ncbi:U1 small nuclear ribonucleoprotein C [Ciona intestinalis]
MPKYFCDYCDTYLTHDSPSVRKTHCSGRKHKDNVKMYYQTWMEEQAQELIDKTTQAFQKGKMGNFGGLPPNGMMMGPRGPMPMMPMMPVRPMGMGGMLPMRPVPPTMMGGGQVMMMGPRPGM